MAAGHWYWPDGTEGGEAAMKAWSAHSDLWERYRKVTELKRDAFVSTVWLSLDHRFSLDSGPPLIFETMAFSRDEALDNLTERQATWVDALESHCRIVAYLEREGY